MTGPEPHFGFEELRRNWGWFLVLGILLIVLGCVALVWSITATVAFVLFLGWLLIVSGIVEAVSAFMARRWSGFFLALLAGVLEFIVGLLVVTHPFAAAEGFTLILGALFLVGGLFQMIGSLMLRFPNWGWELLGGLVNLVLGILVLAKWPYDSLWFIGLLVAIYLLLHGWSWVILALAIRNPPPARI